MKIIDNRKEPEGLSESSFLLITPSPEKPDILARVIQHEDELQIVDLNTGRVFVDNFYTLEELSNHLDAYSYRYQVIDKSQVTFTIEGDL